MKKADPRSAPTYKCWLLKSALLSSVLFVQPAVAQQFDGIFNFGGSYSDAGTYLVDDGSSRRWTINPAPVWNQHLGDLYGKPVTENINVDTGSFIQTFVGGSNYAQGGARIAELPGEAPYNNRSVVDQLEVYLASTNGRVDPLALYSLEGGGNDIFYWNEQILNNPGDRIRILEEAKVSLEAAANRSVSMANRLVELGADRVLMLTIHDIAVTPVANSNGGIVDRVLIDEVTKFNDRVETGLAALGHDNYVLVDLYRYMQELVAEGPDLGFSNVTDASCVPESNFAIFCTSANLVSPDAASTHLFADWVHPSGPGHLAFAQYIQSLLEAPYLVGLTAEVPIADGRAILSAFGEQLWEEKQATGLQVFGSPGVSWLEAEANNSFAKIGGHSGSFRGGFGYHSGKLFDFGAVFSAIQGDYDYSGDRGRFETEVYSGGAYATLNFSDTFVQLSGYGGYIEYPTIQRSFDIYRGGRTNSGSTSGSHYGARLLAGTDVNLGSHTTTPFAGLTYQSVNVDGYEENQNNASTMKFGSQTRESLFTTIGARMAAETQFGGKSVNSLLSISYSHDLLNPARDVIAGLADPGDVLFTTSVETGSLNWIEASAVSTVELRPGIDFNLAAGGQFGDNGQRQLWGSAGITVALP